MLKNWLDDKHVRYTNYNVDKNHIAANNIVRFSGQMGVPFRTIDHDDGSVEKILGFDRARFEAALSENK